MDRLLTLLPELFASADTSRVVASLGYFPALSYFVNTPSQNRIDHRFNGQSRAELVDDLLFLDLRGLGPVQATPSHPDAVPMGWDAFAELRAQVSLPIYALGGMGRSHIAEARRHGGQGEQACGPRNRRAPRAHCP